MILDRKMIFFRYTRGRKSELFTIFSKEVSEIWFFRTQVSLKPVLRFFWLQQELYEAITLPATGVARCLMHLNMMLSSDPVPVSGPVSEAYWGGGCVSVISRKVPDVLCKAPGELVLLEKSPCRKEGYCSSYDYPNMMPCPYWAIQSQCTVLLGHPGRRSTLQSLCCVPSSIPACTARCWASIPSELSACQKACLVLQLPLRLLALTIKRESETTHRPLGKGLAVFLSPYALSLFSSIFYPCFWVGSLLLQCAVEEMVQ